MIDSSFFVIKTPFICHIEKVNTGITVLESRSGYKASPSDTVMYPIADSRADISSVSTMPTESNCVQLTLSYGHETSVIGSLIV